MNKKIGTEHSQGNLRVLFACPLFVPLKGIYYLYKENKKSMGLLHKV